MAKAKTRRKASGRGNSTRTQTNVPLQEQSPTLPARQRQSVTANSGATTSRSNRRAAGTLPPVQQGVITTAMVMLGCWGMTIFFLFLYPDPNHVLFGVFAALMALIWTYTFVMRLRKKGQR